MSADCVKHLRKIPGSCESLFAALQKTTILGTIFILCEQYKLLELHLMYLYTIWLIVIPCIIMHFTVCTCYSIMIGGSSSGSSTTALTLI